MQKTYRRLLEMVVQFKAEAERTVLSEEKLAKIDEYRKRFFESIENDLNTAEAVAIIWEVAKSNIPGRDKFDLLGEFDEVLGLGLQTAENQLSEINEAQAILIFSETDQALSQEVRQLLADRKAAKEAKDWTKADQLRGEVLSLGYTIKDGAGGVQEVQKSIRSKLLD
jgi:cysteinyl-tRNA synthetase